MKKALVISLYGNYNYGNKLQNFAVQKYLKELDIDSEILRYQLKVNPDLKHNLSIKKIYSKLLLKLNQKLVGNQVLQDRKQNFDRFNQNIKYTEKMIQNVDELKDIENQYDYNIIGSDQIWNLGISRIPELCFAGFSNKERNIAFSASFGVDEIPRDCKERYINGLNNFSSISVREDEGKKIVEEFCNKDVEVLLDPTMLINRKVWDEVLVKPKFLDEDEKYILTYFVERTSKERKKKINEIAKKKNLKVISLNDFSNKLVYSIGPEEFIHLIKNAEVIYTDSFHCAVFSILYEKAFYVLKRIDTNGKTNSRIKTLLRRFELTDRSIEQIGEDYSKCDYSNKETILENEKLKAEKFLKEALI